MLLGKVGAEGVNGDVDSTSICFEGEHPGHNFKGGSTDLFTDRVEIFEVGLVKGVADDFDVEVIEIVCGETVAEVWSFEQTKMG